MGVFGGKIGEGVVRYWPPTNSFLLLPILVKIDQEMRPWECPQTDRHTHRHTDTQTDANRFYNLPHAICYSYGADNKAKITSRVYCVKLILASCCLCPMRRNSVFEALKVNRLADIQEEHSEGEWCWSQGKMGKKIEKVVYRQHSGVMVLERDEMREY